MSNDFHLAILAIKRQAETLAVRPNQIIRFPIRRMSFLIGGTPSHTETQAMFAEQIVKGVEILAEVIKKELNYACE